MNDVAQRPTGWLGFYRNLVTRSSKVPFSFSSFPISIGLPVRALHNCLALQSLFLTLSPPLPLWIPPTHPPTHRVFCFFFPWLLVRVQWVGISCSFFLSRDSVEYIHNNGTSKCTQVYTHVKLLHVSANHVAIFRDIKYKDQITLKVYNENLKLYQDQ